MSEAEHRIAARHRTLKSGKIAFAQGAAIDCVIRNISKAGACLEVASPVGIPPAFDLLIDSSGAVNPCRVVWRTERRIGVVFLGGRPGGPRALDGRCRAVDTAVRTPQSS